MLRFPLQGYALDCICSSNDCVSEKVDGARVGVGYICTSE